MILSQWHGQVEHNLRFSLQSSLNIFISFFHDFFVLPFSRLMLYSSKQQYGWYRCNQEYADMYSVCNCLHAEYCLSYNLKYIHTWTIFYPKIILRKALNLSQVQRYHWLFRIQRSRLNKYDLAAKKCPHLIVPHSFWQTICKLRTVNFLLLFISHTWDVLIITPCLST